MPFILFNWCQEVTQKLEQILKNDITLLLEKIIQNQEKIMAEVQLDDSVLTSTAAAIETLVTTDNALVAAVNAFLASPAAAQIPDADLTAINQAVTDAGTANTSAAAAQAALVAATPTTTPPVDTPPATS